MPLNPGVRLGPYEIVSTLGAGGMGEVYRGRDSRLRRDVAIKVLPIEFRRDADRLHRFEQEARAAAALNHPNILAVYDVGEFNGVTYLVSELLEGETLRERVTTEGPPPPRRAVEYAVQIARGLAAAHDKGIVHRDLKPENIFVTTDGQVKILDFGLAKLVEPEPAPAMTGGLETGPGVVMGTLGYMAPEQVRGQPADHRADIFAFGAMLYELLSGRRAFDGSSRADTMTAILKEEPPPLATADPQIPPGLARIVERCLEKNPNARFQSTHDLGFALEGLSNRSDAAIPASSARSVNWRPWALGTLATLSLLAAGVLAVANYRRPEAVPPQAIRFQLMPPGTSTTFSATANFFAVSPDGTQLVFVATSADGTPMLWLRRFDVLEAQPLAGTEAARQPFWSPDSQQIGFFAFGSVKKIAVNGGPAQTLSDSTAVPTGGAWSREGVILFSNLSGPVRRLSAVGGTLSMATALDPERQTGVVHSFPHFLPDGRRFLYHVRSPNPADSGIYAKSLDSDEVRLVVRANSSIAYVASGYLVYVRDGVLMAHPFDVERATTIGDAFPIAEQVDQFSETGLSAFSASQSGVLVYRGSPDAALSRLLWFDRRGGLLGEAGERRPYRNPRLSPDGKRIAVELVDKSGNRDIWLMDIVRGLPVRFTFDPGRDASPIWSADGRTIVWQGSNAVYAKDASGARREDLVVKEPLIPDDWVPDGSGFLCHPNAPRQISLVSMTGSDRSLRPVVEGRATTTHARVSPDGRWVAFASADSGRFEIYVQNFPTPSGRWQVSTAGGIQPKWRADGKELFYLGLDGTLLAVPMTLGVLAEVGKPQVLFRTRVEPSTGLVWHQYDLSPDGQRFLINTPEMVTSPVTVVLNWPALLKP